MKSFVLVLLCVIMAFEVKANATVKADVSDEKKLKVTATYVVSDKSGWEGVRNLIAFSAGDDVSLVTKHGLRQRRKKLLRIIEDLCRVQVVSYEQYVQVAKDLSMKPKAEKKLF